MDQQCLDKLARAVLHAADQNSDDQLEADEWARVVTSVMHAETETNVKNKKSSSSSPSDNDDVNLEQLLDFGRVDADKSGFIDADELIGLFNGLQEIWGMNKLTSVLELAVADLDSPAKQLLLGNKKNSNSSSRSSESSIVSQLPTSFFHQIPALLEEGKTIPCELKGCDKRHANLRGAIRGFCGPECYEIWLETGRKTLKKAAGKGNVLGLYSTDKWWNRVDP